MFFLTRNKLTIFIFLCITTFAGFAATKNYFFHDLGRYMPKDQNDMEFLRQFEEKLEPDDNYLLIGIKSNSGLFNQSFLNKFDKFTRACDTITHVKRALSITNLTRPLKLPFGNSMTSLDLIQLDKPERFKKDSLRIMQDERIPGRFISYDGEVLTVALKIERKLRQPEAAYLIGTVERLLQNFGFDEYHCAGKTSVQTAFSKLIKNEMSFYIFLCLGFLLVALVIIFRKWRTVIIAYISVILGSILFAGVLGLIGNPLDLMGMLFPVLMLIVGMSDVVHFLTKYSDEIKTGSNQMDAMVVTIKEIGWATLLTSATTGAGFASLYFSKIEPIREFGITAAVGVFVAYLTVLFFTTSVLILFKPDQIIANNSLDRFWDRWTRYNYWFVQNNRKNILIGWGIVLVICLIGIYNISTNAFILSDVPKGSELKEDFQFFEDKMAGIKVYEMGILPQGKYKISSPEVLIAIDKLETYVRDNTLVKGLNSPVTAYKMMHRASNGDKASFYKLTGNETRLKKYSKQLNRFKNKQLNVLVSKDNKLGRLSGLMPDIGSDRTKEMNAKVDEWIATNLDQNIVKFQKTGSHYILDKNNEYLRDSLVNSLGLAIIVVCFLMALLFKDIKMVFIALIPNLLPLLIAAAIVGLIGMELKASTSIIFTIAFGIAVDHSIHFLSKFQIEQQKGYSIRGSIYHTFIETGKALYITTLILFFGFSLLIFSSFNAIFYVGLLVSLTLVAALAACLLLTPIVIEWLLEDVRNSEV